MIWRHISILILLLSSILDSKAQEQLFFHSETWDFGTIEERAGRVSHTFVGENRGKTPLVILDVVTTCGCTVPSFSKKPVLPGEKIRITVTFDPTNRPGIFNRELWVYSQAKRKIATLTIRGDVIPRPKSIEERYPVDGGGGLRLNSTLSTYAYIYPDRPTQGSIAIVNTSSQKIRLELRPELRSGLLRITAPDQLDPGEEASINLSYLIPAAQPRYGTIRDALEVVVDGKAHGATIVAHGIGVDPRPAKASQKGPKAFFSENILKFGVVKHDSSPQKRYFYLSNRGGEELAVRAVELRKRITTSLSAGQRIAAGDSIRCQIDIDPRIQEYGILTDHLIVITNDPLRPMRRIRITAVIEE